MTDLNPWFYPVVIQGKLQRAGRGADRDHSYLAARTEYRRPLLVDAVLERYDFKGKAVLDVASNCGYWGREYVKAGATKYLGVEARDLFIKQGRTYWDGCQDAEWRFTRGDIATQVTWDKITALGPFHFTLCAGILYHVRDWRHCLGLAQSHTKEAMLIDTRIMPEEKVKDEGGDRYFNGIKGQREARVAPTLDELVAYLRRSGWTAEVLEHPSPRNTVVDAGDQYERIPGRTAIFSRYLDYDEKLRNRPQ
jgi:hypothetical protein